MLSKLINIIEYVSFFWDSVCNEVPQKFKLEKLRQQAITWKFGGVLTWVV